MKEETKFIGRMKKGKCGIGVTENKYGHAYVVSKSYRNEDGEWKDTNWFNLNDLLDLQALIEGVFEKYGKPTAASGTVWYDSESASPESKVDQLKTRKA